MDERLLNAETIVFDVGNVLLTFEPEKVATLLPEEHREALAKAVFGPAWRWGAFDLGVETNEEIAQSMADEAQVPGGKEMILRAFRDFYTTMRPLPLYNLIPELKAMGKKLYALTNYGEPAFSDTCRAYPNLLLLDGHVVSAREKMVKPDPAFFSLLIRRFQLEPGKTLFIDDAAGNVESAGNMGFRVWHYAGDDILS